MDELRYNSEGYYAPVVYEALTKIEREEREARRKAAYRPLVYICSPYAGDAEKKHKPELNICRVIRIFNFIELNQFLDDATGV